MSSAEDGGGPQEEGRTETEDNGQPLALDGDGLYMAICASAAASRRAKSQSTGAEKAVGQVEGGGKGRIASGQMATAQLFTFRRLSLLALLLFALLLLFLGLLCLFHFFHSLAGPPFSVFLCVALFTGLLLAATGSAIVGVLGGQNAVRLRPLLFATSACSLLGLPLLWLFPLLCRHFDSLGTLFCCPPRLFWPAALSVLLAFLVPMRMLAGHWLLRCRQMTILRTLGAMPLHQSAKAFNHFCSRMEDLMREEGSRGDKQQWAEWKADFGRQMREMIEKEGAKDGGDIWTAEGANESGRKGGKSILRNGKTGGRLRAASGRRPGSRNVQFSERLVLGREIQNGKRREAEEEGQRQYSADEEVPENDRRQQSREKWNSMELQGLHADFVRDLRLTPNGRISSRNQQLTRATSGHRIDEGKEEGKGKGRADYGGRRRRRRPLGRIHQQRHQQQEEQEERDYDSIESETEAEETEQQSSSKRQQQMRAKASARPLRSPPAQSSCSLLPSPSSAAHLLPSPTVPSTPIPRSTPPSFTDTVPPSFAEFVQTQMKLEQQQQQSKKNAKNGYQNMDRRKEEADGPGQDEAKANATLEKKSFQPVANRMNATAEARKRQNCCNCPLGTSCQLVRPGLATARYLLLRNGTTEGGPTDARLEVLEEEEDSQSSGSERTDEEQRENSEEEGGGESTEESSGRREEEEGEGEEDGGGEED